MTTIAEAFERWLEDQAYQRSTIDSTMRMVRRAEEAFETGEPLDDYTRYLKRFVTFAHETDLRSSSKFVSAVRQKFSPQVTRALGALEVEGLEPDEWSELMDFLAESDDDTDAIITLIVGSVVYPASELKATLQEPLDSLKRTVPPVFTATMRRVSGEADCLREYLCPGGTYECAYKRLRRRLTEVGTEIGRSSLNFKDIEATPWQLRLTVLTE